MFCGALSEFSPQIETKQPLKEAKCCVFWLFDVCETEVIVLPETEFQNSVYCDPSCLFLWDNSSERQSKSL